MSTSSSDEPGVYDPKRGKVVPVSIAAKPVAGPATYGAAWASQALQDEAYIADWEARNIHGGAGFFEPLQGVADVDRIVQLVAQGLPRDSANEPDKP